MFLTLFEYGWGWDEGRRHTCQKKRLSCGKYIGALTLKYIKNNRCDYCFQNPWCHLIENNPETRENIIEHIFLNMCANLSTVFLFLILTDFILFFSKPNVPHWPHFKRSTSFSSTKDKVPKLQEHTTRTAGMEINLIVGESSIYQIFGKIVQKKLTVCKFTIG